MGTHRIAALKHRKVLFERHMHEELTHPVPDMEAMRFFEMQRSRIHDLIIQIESNAVSEGAKSTLEAKRQDAAARLEIAETSRASA